MKDIRIIQYTQQLDEGYGYSAPINEFAKVSRMDTEIEYEDDDGDTTYVDAIMIRDKDDGAYKIQQDENTIYNLLTIKF